MQGAAGAWLSGAGTASSSPWRRGTAWGPPRRRRGRQLRARRRCGGRRGPGGLGWGFGGVGRGRRCGFDFLFSRAPLLPWGVVRLLLLARALWRLRFVASARRPAAPAGLDPVGCKLESGDVSSGSVARAPLPRGVLRRGTRNIQGSHSGTRSSARHVARSPSGVSFFSVSGMQNARL